MSDNALKDLCISYDIHNLVSAPTCHKSSIGTLIDVCFVSKPLRFKTTLNFDCWLSDFHNFICITTKLSCPKRPPRVIKYRSYKNFVDELFISVLFISSHTMMYCDYDINMCIDFFVTHLNVIIDKHAPLKYKKVRQNNVPYMNSELRKLNYQRNMLRNVKNKHPCPANIERYRILRNKCVKVKLKSQRQYFSERCDGGSKNQHFWPTIKPFISSKCNLKENIILREEDAIINDASVLSIKSSLLEQGTFEFKHVDTNQIFQILRNMDDKKATGYDGIPCKLLKIGAYPLAEILCKLINISTSQCRFPDNLKLAEISAL